jgi:DNA-binding XRE family transcriptional regulator
MPPRRVAEAVEPSPERQGRRPGVNVIPQRVRRAREEAGLSLADLADGKLSRTAIHLIEMGRTRPSAETLAHIAARTGRPVGYFLGGEAEVSAPNPAESGRRAVDLLRQASWSLAQLAKQADLTEPERVALEGVLLNVRQGIRLVLALRDPH